MEKAQSMKPFSVLAVDLSFRCPAFAVIHVAPVQQIMRLESLFHINNREYDKPYGELIDRIYRAIIHMSKYADVFVREAGCITRTEASKAHFEINAVADIALWHARQTQFRDIPATQVKRLIAGHGKASKEQVAKALQQFICHPYENYDESDAAAVGIASLILDGYTSRNTRPDNCCFIESTARRVAYA